MKLLLTLLALSGLSLTTSASSSIGEKLRSEFLFMKKTVENLEPEFMVGGYLKGKKYGDYELLWHLGETPEDMDTIRIFREKADGQAPFDVSFIRTNHIVPGRNVIRRFVGPAISGWRNDTIDEETGEYLGPQGVKYPSLDERDQEILKIWNLELFETLTPTAQEIHPERSTQFTK